LSSKKENVGYVGEEQLLKNIDWVDDWKVIIPYASDGKCGNDIRVLAIPIVAEPNSACSETYLVVRRFDNQNEAINLSKYIVTKFFRFMVSVVKKTQHGTKEVYRFVPDLDTTKVWTDEELYTQYKLTQKEINFIEKRIKKIEQ